MLLTDRSKLIMGIGGVTALAAGVYTTRFASITIYHICFPFRVSKHTNHLQFLAVPVLFSHVCSF